MVRHQPVLGAGGQHGAFNVGISFLAGAQPQPGMERAGTENGDIGPVAGDQRQGGAAGEQPLFTSHWPPSRISWISARSLNS